VNAETQLFRYRLETDDTAARAAFVASLKIDWKKASPEETVEARRAFTKDPPNLGEESNYYKVLLGDDSLDFSSLLCVLYNLPYNHSQEGTRND
jgi:hypothetical protein